MELYMKNLEYLKIHDIKLWEKSQNPDQTQLSNKLDNIQSTEARDGNKIISIHYGTMEYRLNSAYRPISEAEKWVAQFNLNSDNNVLFMFGLGNGIFARELLSSMESNDIVLIYEPCYDIFNHTLHHYDITDIIKDKRSLLVVEGINDALLHVQIQSMITIYNIKLQKQCIHPNYDVIFGESCVEFFKLIKESMSSAKINMNTNVRFGLRSIVNIMKNMVFLSNSNTLSDLKEYMPYDLPAIVVAAGPSLADNIEMLRAAQGKSVIFAVDRSLDFLLDSGIEPDFAVTIDPMKNKSYFSKREDIEIPLISFVESNSEILYHHKGRKIFGTNNSFVEDIYSAMDKERPRLMGSGSVAIVAYSACVELGFKRIVLVGQDLAFRGDSSHVGGQTSAYNQNANVYVKDFDGNLIESRYDWREFILRYQDLIITNSDVEVIDVKKSGAKIEGTVLMPFSEVVEKYCNSTCDIKSILEKVEFTFNIDELKKIKRHLDNSILAINNMKIKAEKGIKLTDTLINLVKRNDYSEKYFKSNEQLTKINNSIEKNHNYKLIDSIIINMVNNDLTDINQFSDNEKDNQLKTYKKAKLILEAIVEGVKIVREELITLSQKIY